MTGLDDAIAEAARRVLLRRAARLRQEAGRLMTEVVDGRGRLVMIRSPEAVTKLGTAELFEACADDLQGGGP